MNQTTFRSHVQLILEGALERPDQVILQDARHRLTADEFGHLVRDLARRFAAQGVEPGTIVALAAPITVEAVAARYAVSWLGGVMTMCPNATSPDRLAEYLRTVAADVLVYFPSTAASTEEVLTHGAVAAAIRVDPIRPAQLVGLDVDPAPAVGPDQLAVLITSGGTTGGAKASYRSYSQWLTTVDGGPAPTRRQLICSSLAYISQVHLDQTLLGGGTVVLLDHFDPREVLRTIETERITHLGLVEPLLVELADCPDLERRDLSSLVALSHIGADAPVSLRRRLLGRLGPRLVHPYGASEAGIISVLAPAEYRLTAPERLDTCGRPLADVELRIERDDATAAKTGETGLIVVRSAGVAAGYVGGADESPFRPDGWYATGDLGRLDDDGYLHVRGRAKDRRIVGGVALLPLDVQEALCSHPDVRYAVAIPATAPGGGFDAIVRLRPDTRLSLDELRSFVGSRFGARLQPRLLLAVDTVPVTEQGKPDRREIRRVLDASTRRHRSMQLIMGRHSVRHAATATS